MASSSSKLSNATLTRLYSVSKNEKAGDAKQAYNLKEALKFAFEKYDMSKWRKVSSVACGIDRSMIPLPSRIVLKVLRDKGHQCYLVGGCVRDLLLKRAPKDFDVITTANLKQIKNHFHRSVIVGQRFPVCVVNIRGQAIEVSSFDTVANAGALDNSSPRSMPKTCTKTDVLLWRNSMHRDFTVNSLFFDPFSGRIFDYTGGMTDLKSLELRTLIPAHLSFQEDCARILRGLRIAARLNLSVSNDTASAIHCLSTSVLSLAKSRIMLELNYMLSYGAAEPSLSLLEHYNLLQFFFPCHAAILDQQMIEGSSLSSTMLMKLFSNLDKMVACDRPGHCSLWISIMAFHLALNIKPQEPMVIWTFSSLLCTKNWSRSTELARESAQKQPFSAPEILKSANYMEDDELAHKVSELASLVATSIDSLTREPSLHKSISRFREAPPSVLVFVSEKCGKETARLFSMFDSDIKLYTTGRKRGDVDYQALKKGEALETRFVLGQVIMDTMSGKVNEAIPKHNQDATLEDKTHKQELEDHNLHPHPFVHGTEREDYENEKFNELSTKPITGNLEKVESINSKTPLQNLDMYFFEELGPSLKEKSDELITVARTYSEEKIEKRKQSQVLDHGTELASKQEENIPSSKMTANRSVKVKIGNVKQVIETLQLQTEIKFSDDNENRVNQTTSKISELRQEALSKNKGGGEPKVNETNNRKSLSSLFNGTTMENTSKKLVEMWYGNSHQRPSDQTEDVNALNEKRTSENFGKDTNSSNSEAHFWSSSSDEELLNIGRMSQTKTTRKQNVSERLPGETESLISILGTRPQKTMKKQGFLVTLSQAIREKFHDGKNSLHDAYPDKMKDPVDGDIHLPSDNASDQETVPMKSKLIKTPSKLHEVTRTGLKIAKREISEPPIVDDGIQKLHEDTSCQTIEDNTETVKSEKKTSSRQDLSDNLEPGTKIKTGRRTSRKSENLANLSDEVTEETNEEKMRQRSGNNNKETDKNHKIIDDNIQQQATATKKRKTRQRQSEHNSEMKAVFGLRNNVVPDQYVDADIMEVLGEIKFQKFDTDKKETGVSKEQNTADQKQEKIDISSEKTNEVRFGETADAQSEIQEQKTTKKKRKPRKTQSKAKDQPATDDGMQLKTAIEFTNVHLHTETNIEKASNADTDVTTDN